MRRIGFAAFALAGLLAALALARHWTMAGPPLPQAVYVWQRQWDAETTAAVAPSRDLFHQYRVLGLQWGSDGRWVKSRADLATLAASKRAVAVVMRIEGTAPLAIAADAAGQLRALLAEWRIAGIRVSGIEFDHDCATSQLTVYAQWLRTVRASLPEAMPIGITALPTWRTATELDGVLQAVDYSVLQVHAVRRPEEGLFDAELARQWIDEWAVRTGSRPFDVALPAYGVRVEVDDTGKPIRVDGEQDLPRTAQGRELVADPVAVARLLETLQRRPVQALREIVWFRLPRRTDQRAWSLRTLRAVIERKPLAIRLDVALHPVANGAGDVVVTNNGNRDGVMPGVVVINGRCAGGDGVNGYQFTPERFHLRMTPPPVLRAGHRRTIGWIRCDAPATLHIEP
ncbi:DUF3142 domain-containing protein [Tahibacter amnicola]|uniref:DUF3142 domain-containing protein n=1 Tax=Tahibacter amnicola TaxID=2976241 RepID=A0ABY6BD61_9GAMM|nr:DUF3142 domain-containing protein [Tahibacter amnicola]UXI67742.1 DUF3142 domain-containing protein [Tahibacter amnicola]